MKEMHSLYHSFAKHPSNKKNESNISKPDNNLSSNEISANQIKPKPNLHSYFKRKRKEPERYSPENYEFINLKAL